MKDALVFVVVVNWNLKDLTLACLDSIYKLSYPNLRVIVVDNASDDGSTDAISDRFPQVEQIINHENVGFGKGFNTGIRRALELGADYILMMNNDAWIETQGIEKLILHANDQVGIVAPIIYYADAPDKIWSAGGVFRPLTLEIKHKKHPISKQDRPSLENELDFVSGCITLLPRQTFERVGLFDEKFFAYYEDMDFAVRIRQAGLRILLVPNVHAWHKVSMSSGGSYSPNERYWMARSSIRYFKKHSKWWQKPIILFYRFGSALKMTCRLIIGGRYSSVRAYWRGLMDGITENCL